MNRPCTLILEDGSEFVGWSFGSDPIRVESPDTSSIDPVGIGEVVFNTAMCGYHEALTDPSYCGQIVAMTYPHIGNYGCDPAWGETGPEDGRRRRQVKPAGYATRALYDGPIPPGRITLDEFLKSSGVPGIAGIDTRRLTLLLRESGSQNGAIVSHADDSERLSENDRKSALSVVKQFPSMLGRNLISVVGSGEPAVFNPEGAPAIALFDCGVKANILRQLVGRGCRVVVLPSDSPPDALDGANVDALFISSGPGDPAVLESQVQFVKAAIGRMPVLGICLGHQLIARAVGARTYKMKFGHHGVNHPVREEGTGRVFVTSQNHGFGVDEQTLPAGCRVWFRNANDQSIEGVRDDDRRLMTAQFHPESAPGPDDALWIFDEFLKVVG